MNYDYTTIVTFGDARSDTGNSYRISNHTWPPVPPFSSNGAFTDNLLWNQILTQELLHNASLQDFSYNGGTTDSQLVQGTMSYNPNLIANYYIRNNTKPPGVRQQISEYINAMINKTIDFDLTLYIIWAGVNNYYFNASITPLQTIQSIITCLNTLILFGGRNFIIINELPWDRFPHFRNGNTANLTKYLAIGHNLLLAKQMNDTYFSSNTRLNIHLFDSYTFVSKVLDNYTAYGFENLDNCWDTDSNSTVIIKCSNTTKRIFIDEYHFTSAMHRLLAKELYSTLDQSNSTSTGLSLISIQLSSLFIIVSTVLLFQIN